MKLIRNLFKNKFVLFCIIAPSLGATIYVLSFYVYLRLSYIDQTHAPAWRMLYVPFLSLIIGLPFLPPAFFTFVFNESYLVKKNRSRLFKIIVTAIFGGMISFIYIVCLAREAKFYFYIHIFCIGMFCAGFATYFADNSES